METTNIYDGEQIESFEPRCSVCFVIDRSMGMSGEPIFELNKELQIFEYEIKNDKRLRWILDIAVISFGSNVIIERDFGLIDKEPISQIVTNGSCRLVDGARKGIEMITNRKNWYRSSGQTFYRPYLVLITDGDPDGNQDLVGIAKEIRDLVNTKHLNFFIFGVVEAEMNILEMLALQNIRVQIPPMNFDGLKMAEIFKGL